VTRPPDPGKERRLLRKLIESVSLNDVVEDPPIGLLDEFRDQR
jgi:hypothetical protein